MSQFKKQENLSKIAGLLPVYKPPGIYSKDVSRFLQKHLARKHPIGHVGTLDPLAEGVLPILLGKATKLQQYLLKTKKIYRFQVQFGFSTTTQDLEGEIVRRKEYTHILVKDIQSAISAYRGEVIQTPPLYSAIKWQGKPLYWYARKNIPVNLQQFQRRVTIYDWKLLSFSLPHCSFLLTCSSGTYVRSLVNYLSEKLNTAAVIQKIIRLETAGCHASKTLLYSLLIDQPEQMFSHLIPINQIPLDLYCWHSPDAMTDHCLRQGQSIPTAPFGEPTEKLLRILSNSGNTLGIGTLFFCEKRFFVKIIRRLD